MDIESKNVILMDLLEKIVSLHPKEEMLKFLRKMDTEIDPDGLQLASSFHTKPGITYLQLFAKYFSFYLCFCVEEGSEKEFILQKLKNDETFSELFEKLEELIEIIHN